MIVEGMIYFEGKCGSFPSPLLSIPFLFLYFPFHLIFHPTFPSTFSLYIAAIYVYAIPAPLRSLAGNGH